MRVFKKEISTCKILLCASVLINVLLVGVVYVAESHTHAFEQALIRRGIVKGNDDDTLSPDYWARVGWTNTIEKLHTNFDIAFFGNSITRGSDFQLAFPDKKIINLGYSGDNTLGMIKRIPMLQACHPKKIFIMAGTNDIFHVSVDEFIERYNNLLNAIHDSIPTAKIYLESIMPMNQDMKDGSPSDEKIRHANTKIAEIAKIRGLKYLDVYSLYVKDGKLPAEITKDGIHLFPEKYDRWAKLIESYVNE